MADPDTALVFQRELAELQKQVKELRERRQARTRRTSKSKPLSFAARAQPSRIPSKLNVMLNSFDEVTLHHVFM
jgi:hypothetical protein